MDQKWTMEQIAALSLDEAADLRNRALDAYMATGDPIARQVAHNVTLVHGVAVQRRARELQSHKNLKKST